MTTISLKPEQPELRPPGAVHGAIEPIRTRLLAFSALCLIGVLAVYVQISDKLQFLLDSELYSHTFLVPFLSAYLIWSSRKPVFAAPDFGIKTGGALAIASSGIYFLGLYVSASLSVNDHLSMMIFAFILLSYGAFIACFGLRAFQRAVFPLLFLLFMAPVPDAAMDGFISVLQSGSAEVAWRIFNLTGVPAVREGFVFHMSGLNIEVAKECSGIRSSVALLITGLVAGHLYLRSASRKAVLALAVLPICIVKNGLRITVLSLAGIYIDERALSGSLHTRGGIPFFALALILLGGVLGALKRSEKNRRRQGP